MGINQPRHQQRIPQIPANGGRPPGFQFCGASRFQNFPVPNGDGRISRYEAQRVRSIDCSGRGIASLFEIGEFENLESLDCSRNEIVTLDVSSLARLTELDCSQNRLTRLDLGQLRGLVRLDCAENELASLDPGACTSLSALDGRGNRYPTLDVSGCSQTLAADLTDNPQLELVYAREGQNIRAEGATEVIYR